jgi:hypothetical protein
MKLNFCSCSQLKIRRTTAACQFKHKLNVKGRNCVDSTDIFNVARRDVLVGLIKTSIKSREMWIQGV